jgi:hypothetical protein
VRYVGSKFSNSAISGPSSTHRPPRVAGQHAVRHRTRPAAYSDVEPTTGKIDGQRLVVSEGIDVVSSAEDCDQPGLGEI